ncbi:MAG TPA: potassium channel protein [Vicinamibacteria bacterium]|nr:potassium channel protein [Vicinamibacteria bacterium]
MDPTSPSSLTEQLRPFVRRFSFAAFYFVVIAILGTAGFVVLEDWSWFDALYMAVTTVSSVGFMEVHPLSPQGRILAMVLVILGVTGLGLWWGLTTALIVELDLGGWLRSRRIMNRVSRLKNHFIICGGGRMGSVVMAEMRHSSRPFVVVEKAAERVARVLQRHPDVLILEADATQAQTLLDAGIERASGLAACLTDDASNLFLCLTARGIRTDLTIVARAYDEESFDKLRRAGADHVISPNITGGARMASMLLRPSVVSFLDAALTGPDDVTLHLEEAEITNGSSLAGTTLLDARIPQQTGLIVLAVRKGGLTGEARYNPGPETKLDAGDVVIVLGRLEQLERLRQYAGDGR